MDLAQARADLAALPADGSVAERLGALRRLLIGRGAEVPGCDPATLPTLEAVLAQAASAAAHPARRGFAILVALTAGDLRGARPPLVREICRLLESALPDVLARAGYPFGANLDARWLAATRLHTRIDLCLPAPEPTFPPWLGGLEPHRQG